MDGWFPLTDLRQSEDSQDGIKLFVGHVTDCFCADDEAPFVVYRGFDYQRDKAGRPRRNGMCWWHLFKCNDPKCSAVAGVRWDTLANFIGRSNA